jgi:streptomycin 3"-adenylyltransferase
VPRAQHLADCDRAIRGFVLEAVRILRSTLGAPLAGAWLHGSLATGAWHRPKSDIDLLLVCNEPIDAMLRAVLEQALLALSDSRPITGDLDLHILLASHARDFTHPLPFEFRYNETVRQRIRAGDARATGPGFEPDLAVHCTLVRQHGIPIHGPPPASSFAPVPRSDFLAAIRADLHAILEDQRIIAAPCYCVLNACNILRILEQAEEDDSLDYTKQQAAAWALENLPTTHRPLLRRALEIHCASEPVDEAELPTGGRSWDASALLAFRDHVADRLTRLPATQGPTGPGGQADVSQAEIG